MDFCMHFDVYLFRFPSVQDPPSTAPFFDHLHGTEDSSHGFTSQRVLISSIQSQSIVNNCSVKLSQTDKF